jgi:hypothetical protein
MFPIECLLDIYILYTRELKACLRRVCARAFVVVVVILRVLVVQGVEMWGGGGGGSAREVNLTVVY